MWTWAAYVLILEFLEAWSNRTTVFILEACFIVELFAIVLGLSFAEQIFSLWHKRPLISPINYRTYFFLETAVLKFPLFGIFLIRQGKDIHPAAALSAFKKAIFFRPTFPLNLQSNHLITDGCSIASKLVGFQWALTTCSRLRQVWKKKGRKN